MGLHYVAEDEAWLVRREVTQVCDDAIDVVVGGVAILQPSLGGCEVFDVEPPQRPGVLVEEHRIGLNGDRRITARAQIVGKRELSFRETERPLALPPGGSHLTRQYPREQRAKSLASGGRIGVRLGEQRRLFRGLSQVRSRVPLIACHGRVIPAHAVHGNEQDIWSTLGGFAHLWSSWHLPRPTARASDFQRRDVVNPEATGHFEQFSGENGMLFHSIVDTGFMSKR